MIIYSSGYKVRAELITLFKRSDVVAFCLAKDKLIKSVAKDKGDSIHIESQVEFASTLGILEGAFNNNILPDIRLFLGQMQEAEDVYLHGKREFHWSEIKGIRSCNPFVFSVDVRSVNRSEDESEKYVHDGGSFLIVREGVDGPVHKVKISAIHMVEFSK